MALFAGFLDFARKDVNIPNAAPSELLLKQHSDFIYKYEQEKDSCEYIMAEPLRLSAIYWAVSAQVLMGELGRMSRGDIIDYKKSCQKEDGGFAPAPEHDSRLLHTLSAVQILIIFGALDQFDLPKIANFVKSLQNTDGSFGGDVSNEVDTQFSFCALATLHLIGHLDKFDVKPAVEFVVKCYNFDGGFGTRPGSESHSGQVYCCLGALAITGMLDSIDRDRTADGAFNGRPEKLPDVCYSWWVLSSLSILKRIHWINKDALSRFIYACQDTETGGFADRPGDYPDPFHTVFGVAALSLLGHPEVQPVDAVFCMTKRSLGEKSLC